MKAAIFLLGAIIFEVIGTTMLNLSDGFTNILPTVIMFICFALSFVCLIGALKTIPLSIAYSVWAGLGTAGAAIIGIGSSTLDWTTPMREAIVKSKK